MAEKNDAELASSGKKFLFWVLFLIIILGSGWSFWHNYNTRDQNTQTTSQLSEKEIADILEKVGKHILLPDEQPTIATVQDAGTLAQVQAFFRDSQNGDQVLVYSDRAYIYRPSEDKLINAGPVFANPAQEEQPEQPNPADARLTIDIRNGSEAQGAARAMADTLTPIEDFGVVGLGNAARSDYSGNLVVNLSGESLGELGRYVNAVVTTTLPTGEAQSTADVVIILGN